MVPIQFSRCKSMIKEVYKIKIIIHDLLDEHGAMKATVLVTEVAKKFYNDKSLDQNGPDPDIVDIINKMVEAKEICEVEYVLKGTARIKSVYFPKETKLRIV